MLLKKKKLNILFDDGNYISKFKPKNEILIFIFTENRSYKKNLTSLKSRMQKTEVEKSSFFHEISVECKPAKHPYDYMKRKQSRICLMSPLNASSIPY